MCCFRGPFACFCCFLTFIVFPYADCISSLILFLSCWFYVAVKAPDSTAVVEGASAGLTGITVDKSVEFSYEELANATDDFSLANKIGQGGFGAVYYAELRGEVCCLFLDVPSSGKMKIWILLYFFLLVLSRLRFLINNTFDHYLYI